LVKIVDNNGQYKITIPKDVMESKGWNSKTKLRFVEDVEGNIILRPIPENAKRAKKKKE
jgi:bifunctional DNA-binding transcriptional regulator/antitoxin component of YhaV-PrlF toxin-antitoxin module